MNFTKLQDNYFNQVHNLMMFIITAVAVIVGVAQFVSRSWVQNDMNSKIADVTYTLLTYVYNISHKLALIIEEKEIAV
jgi:hypothetical protein